MAIPYILYFYGIPKFILCKIPTLYFLYSRTLYFNYRFLCLNLLSFKRLSMIYQLYDKHELKFFS